MRITTAAIDRPTASNPAPGEPPVGARRPTTPVAIAGTGVISAIGRNAAECLQSFEKGEAGMGEIGHFQTIHRLPVAEVKADNATLAQWAGLRPDRGSAPDLASVSRTALLSLLAAREALDHAAIPDLSRWRTGFISANTVGGMDRTEQFYPQFLDNPRHGRLRDVILHECGHITEWVAEKLDIRHFRTTISTACSSSANAIGFGARMLRQGLLDVAVAGGTDALTRFTLNGFNSLMILDSRYCKPFDNDRMGLNLGEGAGYVVLVSDRVAATLPKTPGCYLSGFANANDAYHQTASSPDGRGSWLAMKGALQRASLEPGDIDYINLHGTGTENNDLAEGTAIRRLFDPVYPPMSSTKSFTGHTLGASGGIEAVFSVLALQHGIVYPNLRFHTPIPGLPFTPVTQLLKGQPLRHVLSNSFGFGGNCTSLVFSAAPGASRAQSKQ
jgi:3-oxoacyl-(acyl-carrier-protein) synthase